MKNSSIIKVLQQMSTRERSKFGEYVFSPYFNKNKKVRKLCELLLTHAPAFDHPKLEKRKLFKKVFETAPYNELKLNNVISDLLQLLYAYLAQKAFDSSSSASHNFLLNTLLEREMHPQLKRASRRYEQARKNQTYKNYDYYLGEYTFYDIKDRIALSGGKRGFDQNLQQKSDMLDLYYFSNKLRIACDMTSRNIVINANYQCHFLEELENRYKNNEAYYGEIPALKIYYKTLEMLHESENEVHYFELKQLLKNHVRIFPQQELRTLYNYALNFCVKKINSGETAFYREILSLYKVLLDEKIIYKNNYLTQWTYTNIITAGIRLKDYDWTEKFIHHYKNDLLPEERPNVFTYNLAALFFEKGNFDKALQQLHEVEFTDAFYHLAAKIIQLKSYYELNETEALLALIEAFKKFVGRNKQLSDYQKKSNLNFAKAVSWLSQLKIKEKMSSSGKYADKKIEINKRIALLDPLANKDWLEQVC